MEKEKTNELKYEVDCHSEQKLKVSAVSFCSDSQDSKPHGTH